MDDRLSISITHSDGTMDRWGADEPAAEDIPGDTSFGTQIPGGFRDLSCSLLRRIDIDYSDLNLYDSVRVYGPGNRTAWEGYAAQFPRSHGDSFEIQPGAVGWSATLNWKTFREIYVDRDFGSWGGASVQRRLSSVGSFTVSDPSVTADVTTGQPSLSTGWTGAWTAATKPLVQGWYNGRGIPLGSLYYAWKKNANVSNTDANWSWEAFLSTDDLASSVNTSGNLRAAGPGTGTVSTSGAAKLFASAWHYYNTGPGGSDNAEYAIYWTVLAVYGTHGLTKQGTDSATSARGFYASDVVRDIVTRTAPQLTIGTVDATTFVIPHLVFLDPTSGEDAIQFVNAYHGYEWGVYDNRAFFWRASDPDRLTWQARLSTGARLDLEGETAEQVYNGVYVTYTDPAGVQKTVGPPGTTADATDSSLQDTSATNPLNEWGYTRHGVLQISQTTTQAGAVQLGATWLAEHAVPQRRGTLTLTGTVTHPTEGEVPVWRVRAGDYVSISDHPTDVPRRIIETRYTHGSRTLSASLDNTPHALDSILGRLGVSLVGVL